MKTKLTRKLADKITLSIGLYLNDAVPWTESEIYQEIYNSGIQKGRREQIEEIKKVLGIR